MFQLQYFCIGTFTQNYIKRLLSQLELMEEEFVRYRIFFSDYPKFEELIKKVESSQISIKVNTDLIFTQFDYEFNLYQIRGRYQFLDGFKNLKSNLAFCIASLKFRVVFIKRQLEMPYKKPATLKLHCQHAYLDLILSNLHNMVQSLKFDFIPKTIPITYYIK